MAKGESEGGLPSHLRTDGEYLLLPDGNNNVYRILASLYGQRLPEDRDDWLGAVDEYNSDLLTALAKGWIDRDGNFTDAGHEELARRRKLLREDGFQPPADDLAVEEAGAKNAFLPASCVRQPRMKTAASRFKTASVKPNANGDPAARVKAILVKFGFPENKFSLTGNNGFRVLKLLAPEKTGGNGRFVVLRRFQGKLEGILFRLDEYLSACKTEGRHKV